MREIIDKHHDARYVCSFIHPSIYSFTKPLLSHLECASSEAYQRWIRRYCPYVPSIQFSWKRKKKQQPVITVKCDKCLRAFCT